MSAEERKRGSDEPTAVESHRDLLKPQIGFGNISSEKNPVPMGSPPTRIPARSSWEGKTEQIIKHTREVKTETSTFVKGTFV